MPRFLIITIAALGLIAASCGVETSTTTEVGAGPTDEGLTDEGLTDGGPLDGQEPASPPADGLTRLWIKPDLVDCEGVAPQTCMQVAEGADGPYELFYDAIDGFTHIEGTSYVVDVRITEVDDPPADASSLAYALESIVDETVEG